MSVGLHVGLIVGVSIHYTVAIQDLLRVEDGALQALKVIIVTVSGPEEFTMRMK